MKKIYDDLSFNCSKSVTQAYSTSFNWAVNMLSPSIQMDIHSIYGFVRIADEVVDTFHDYDKETLINEFEEDVYKSIKMGISLNPILNSFQKTVNKYNIDLSLIDAFLRSMKMDLVKSDYNSVEEYKDYIYGSADAVGLMCLFVFVNGDSILYNNLKESAMRLGSAFQKVNFLRDLRDDNELLNRSYFPNLDLHNFSQEQKNLIINEIEEDFMEARKGIVKLPNSAKFGVYTAFVYYSRLLSKLKQTPYSKIMLSRIRISNFLKARLLFRAYINCKLNLLS